MKKATVALCRVLCMVLLVVSAAAPAERSQQARTFTGEIIERLGKFVLRDAAGKKIWGLDRQDKARPFAGRKVTVSGNYSSVSRMIQVRNIQATVGRRSIPPWVAHPDPTGPITPPTFPSIPKQKDLHEGYPVTPRDPTTPTTTKPI